MKASPFPDQAISATYALAAPSGWVRALLRPLFKALAQVVPAQATAQRLTPLQDREFVLPAELPGGMRAELAFRGPILSLALLPPATGVATHEHDRANNRGEGA